jgi:ascorbate-specific PTS system EIIC-type component UlaA
MESQSNVQPAPEQPERPEIINPTPPTIDPEIRFLQEVGRPLFEMSGWLKFLGIGMIVYIILVLLVLLPGMLFLTSASSGNFSDQVGGELMAVMLCSFVFALVPLVFVIWLYYQLYKAGKFASIAQKNMDKNAMITSLKSLKTFFIVTGILTIISFVGVIIYGCVLALIIPAGMGNLF